MEKIVLQGKRNAIFHPETDGPVPCFTCRNGMTESMHGDPSLMLALGVIKFVITIKNVFLKQAWISLKVDILML